MKILEYNDKCLCRPGSLVHCKCIKIHLKIPDNTKKMCLNDDLIPSLTSSFRFSKFMRYFSISTGLNSDTVSRKCSQYIRQHGVSEVSVAHYTGRVTYDTTSFPEVNRDFVPPEIIETLRSSQDPHIKLMFTNQLTKCGNLTLDEGCPSLQSGASVKWNA